MLNQNIIVIVHNQKEQFIEWLNVIADNIEINWSQFVIVDNCSNDGLNEILKDTDFNYVFCEERESYAVIINTVVSEFVMEDTVYVTSPKYTFDFNIIQKLNEVLKKEKFMAVSQVEADAGILFEYLKSYDLNPMCILYVSAKNSGVHSKIT